MAVYRTRVGTIAYKAEVTEGTAETSGLASDVRVQNLSFNPTLDQFQRPIQASTFGTFTAVPGAKSCEVGFDVAPTGNSSLANLGSVGAEPHTLLLACGAEPTLTGGASAQYDWPKVTGTNQKSITLRSHIDGKAWYGRGMRGNLKISGQVGQPILFSPTFKGVYDHEEVDIAVPAVSYQTVLPAPLLAANASVGGTSLKILSFEINIDNGLVLRPDISNVDGYVSCIIAMPTITGTVVFEPEVVGTFDAFSRAEDATEGSFSIESGVGTTANHLVISSSVSKVQLLDVRHSSNSDLLTYTARLQFNRSAGDDCLRVKWSA